MRIAILGSIALPVPPPMQGGTEWIAYYQATGLSSKGHEIILFAAKGTSKNFGGSRIKVIEIGEGNLVAGGRQERKIDTFSTESSRKLRIETSTLSLVAKRLIELKDEYDIVLNNMRGEAIFLPVLQLLNKPFVNVMHLNVFRELAEAFKEYNAKIITISNSQRKDFPNLNYLTTIYNCVDVDKFTFNDAPQDYLLMIGSIGWHKNQGEAIAVAKELGLKLILAGKIRDQDYFEELKIDIDGEQIKYLSEVSFEEKVKLYRNAKAFLFPVLWEEPFGLVMIEAMACGTPVVAFNHGAVPEVVRDGLTGYIVENHSQMAEAVKKIDNIDRTNCRKHIEENFTVKKMIDDYETALKMLL